MSGPEEMIADALREIAAQAGAPRPMADAAWRAGRRRLAALTASAVAGAAVIVAAVLLLPLAAHRQPPLRPASQPGPAPVSLRSPIQFRQVAAISNASCPAGSGGLPGTPDSAAPACFYLTGTGMTVTAVQSAQVVLSGTGGYQLDIVLTRAQTGPFAALTRQVTGLPSPRDQVAIIIDGRVIADPAVQGPITNGSAQITGFATRAQAESLLSSLRNQ
jgi:hypothetical protein